MAQLNNGKASEIAVKAALDAIKEPSFDYQRMYDATSARNAFMAQVGDFQFFMPGVHGVIEVKSTAHEFRLGKAAFSENQRAKLTRRMNAGGKVWVVVHHWQTGVWRCLPYDTLHEAFDVRSHASVDLRDVETLNSAAEAVMNLIERSLA